MKHGKHDKRMGLPSRALNVLFAITLAVGLVPGAAFAQYDDGDLVAGKVEFESVSDVNADEPEGKPEGASEADEFEMKSTTALALFDAAGARFTSKALEESGLPLVDFNANANCEVYRIFYDGGADATGEMTPDEVILAKGGEDVKTTLKPIGFENHGREFIGWKATADGLDDVLITGKESAEIVNMIYTTEVDGETVEYDLRDYADDGVLLIEAVWGDRSYDDLAADVATTVAEKRAEKEGELAEKARELEEEREGKPVMTENGRYNLSDPDIGAMLVSMHAAEETLAEIVAPDTQFDATHGLRLVVKNPASIREGDVVLSSGEGVWLLAFANDAALQSALQYYSEHAEFAAVDGSLSVAEGDAAITAAPAGDFSAMGKSPRTGAGTIALIDTGVPADADVDARLSVLADGSVDDANGHGTTMLGFMREVNPDARVVSIKAVGDDGVASASAVYAAIKKASSMGCDYINLSMSARAIESNEIVAQAIREAHAQGVTVVGAAGNNGLDAKNYVPGGVNEAVVVGATENGGFILESSNYGETVDVYAEARSTSEACARVCAGMAACGLTAQDIDYDALHSMLTEAGVRCYLRASSVDDGGQDEGALYDDDGQFRVALEGYTTLQNWTPSRFGNRAWGSVTTSGSAALKGVIYRNGTAAMKMASGSTFGRAYQWQAGNLGSNLYKIQSKESTSYYWYDNGQVMTSTWADNNKHKFYIGYVSGYESYGNPYVIIRTANNTGYSLFSRYNSANSTSTSAIVETASNSDGSSYCHWCISPCGINVSYSANGGSGSASSVTPMIDSSFTTPGGTTFSRTGYSWDGWNNSSGTKLCGKGGSLTASNLSTTSGASVTLYARWVGNTYYVRYNANGGSGTMSNSTHTYGTSSSLRSNGFTAPTTSGGGWYFAGWATTKARATAGTVDYSNGASVSTLTSTSGGTVDLYAVWKRTIAFKSGSGSATTTNVTQLWNGSAGVNITSATAANCTNISGWSELGWRADNAAAAQSVSFSTSFSPTTTTYQAVYSRTATFYSGSGKSTTKTATQYYNTYGSYAVAIPAAPTAISGWSAAGWRTDTSASSASYGTTGTITGSGQTYYAVYTRAITFYHGSNNAKSTGVTQYYNTNGSSSNITTPTAATCTDISGYTELGWRPDGTASTASVAFNTSISPTSTTYRAVYSRSVTFYHGYNKGANTSVTQYYNSNNAWACTTPTAATCTDVTTWTELGWRADTTASSASWGFNSGCNSSSNVFYAVYSRSGTVSYAGNGATSGSTTATTSGTQYLNSGNTSLNPASLSVTLASNGFTKTGHTFSKWDIGNAGAAYSWTPAYNASTAKTATAVWTANRYTLTIDPNGGSWGGTTGTSTATQDYGTTKSIAAPTRTGYTFLGWAETGPGSLSGLTNADPSFDSSSGGVSVYNNSGGSGVAHTLQASSANTTYYGSREINIAVSTAATSPGLGGFVQNTSSAAGKKYIHAFVARIPVGYSVQWAANAGGNERTVKWLTPTAGTGQYELYAYQYNCGTTGSFSTFGHVYIVSGDKPMSWQLAYSSMFDITGGTTTTYTYGAGAGRLTALWSPTLYNQTVRVRYENADGSWSAWTNVINEERYYGSTVSWSRDADDTYQAASISYTVSGAATQDVSVYRMTSTNTIYASYQNEDGSYGNYSVVAQAVMRVGEVLSWSRAQDATYLAASSSITAASWDDLRHVQIYRRFYAISFDGNGATSGSMNPVLATNGSDVTLPSNQFAKTGYRFKEWLADVVPNSLAYMPTIAWARENGSSNYGISFIMHVYYQGNNVAQPVDFECGSTGLVTGEFTPQSTGTYQIIYGANRQVVNETRSAYVDLTAGVTYQLSAWISENDTEQGEMLWASVAEKSTSSATYSDGATVNRAAVGALGLSAQWDANTYTVAYDGNGATSGSTPSTAATYGTAAHAAPCGYVRVGYKFTGWNTAADGMGADIAVGGDLLNLTDEHQGTVTLFAKWEPISYTIHFDAAGGTGTVPADITATYDTPVTMPSADLVKDGRGLAGWTPVAPMQQNGGQGSLSTQSALPVQDSAEGHDVGNVTAEGGDRKQDGGFPFVEKAYADEPEEIVYYIATAVKNLTATDGDTVTLYAVYEKPIQMPMSGMGGWLWPAACGLTLIVAALTAALSRLGASKRRKARERGENADN